MLGHRGQASVAFFGKRQGLGMSRQHPGSSGRPRLVNKIQMIKVDRDREGGSRKTEVHFETEKISATTLSTLISRSVNRVQLFKSVNLGALGGVFGGLEGVLKASWRHLGGSWQRPGGSWGRRGGS